MKPREYCCCAIPVIYTGIYIAILEQFALGIIAGVLSIATSSIVGAATPSFAKWLFAIICWVGAGLQLLGFAAVRKEWPIMFRRYTTLHLLITVAAFAVAAAWIIISATKHTQAEATCKSTFYPGTNSVIEDESNTLCNIFPWVDIGIMSGLWVLLAIVQVYLFFVLVNYAAGQERDHDKYDALYDPTAPLSGDIPLRTRGDPWDSRPSTDSLANPRGYHDRSDSVASVSTVMGDKVQQTRDFNNYGQTSYSPVQPGNAYTQEPGPTPRVTDGYYRDDSHDDVEYPERSRAHPAEGSFRRKTPRLQKPQPDDYNIAMIHRR